MDVSMEDQKDVAIMQHEEEDPQIDEAGEEEEEDEKPKGKRAPRKRKRRAMDAHLLGMTEDEIAAYKASVLGDFADAPKRSGSSARDLQLQQPEPSPEPEVLDEYTAVSPNKLPDDEIAARRRLLRTDWRMAAFSQFHIAFPMMCLRGFDIDLLERDLEGTNPGSYVGEVISRLMYTLTKDSRLAGDNTKDKPWLIRLRREFIRRDPKHNKLGDGPISLEEYWDDEEPVPRNKQGSHVPPSVDGNVKSEAATPQPEVQSSSANLAPPSVNGLLSTADASGTVTPAIKSENGEPRVLLPHEWTESYGWEDLTLKEQIYALWSITEWQLQNAEKFRNNLTKYRVTEEEHVTWRIEPIGRDSDYNVYWLFDDNRLWIERETPRKKELRLISEQTDAINAYKRRQREKRILRQQKERMWALHERRRQRTAAKKAAEEALDREIAAMDATQRAAHFASNKGKRKREDSDDDDDDAGESVRTSSRIGQARLAERMANRPARRRSTRTSEGSSAIQLEGDEEWQKIPPEWLKSEDQEKDEDPDFGAEAEAEAKAEEEEDGNESDLSVLDEDEELAEIMSKHKNRSSSRRSPRKTVNMAEDQNLSDLSDLSDGQPSEESEDEEAPPSNVTGETYAQSAYNMGPSYDSEDDELPAGFVRFEALCTDMSSWETFAKRFAKAKDEKEIALHTFVQDQVLLGVKAGYDSKEAERQKKIAQRKAQIRKERQKAQQAALAAERAAEREAASSSSNVRSLQSNRTRSSRAPKKELTEEEKRQQLLNERVNYSEKNLFANAMSGRNTRAGSETGDGKAFETDRRALRAKQREEEKRQREEADMLRQLEEAEAEAQPDQANKSAAAEDEDDEIGVPVVQVNNDDGDEYVPNGDGEDVEMDAADEYLPPGQAGEFIIDEDYRLDCSICRRKGVNLDAGQKLVGCDMCDRWEHVVCHRKAAEKAGLPKPDFDNDDFICEDCQLVDESVVIPAAPKRARTEKQLAGALKGAEKRKAKFEARRKEKERTKRQSAASQQARSSSVAESAQSPPSSSRKPSKPRPAPKSRNAGANNKENDPAEVAKHAAIPQIDASLVATVGQPTSTQATATASSIPYFGNGAGQHMPTQGDVPVMQPALSSYSGLPAHLAQSETPLQGLEGLLAQPSAQMQTAHHTEGQMDISVPQMATPAVDATQTPVDPALAGQ